MFNNIGGKIKTLAVVVCVIGMIGSAIGAIAMWANGVFLGGLVILGVGCLTSWIGSFFTYGLGQLIEDTMLIRERLENPHLAASRAAVPQTAPAKPAAAAKLVTVKHEEPELPAMKHVLPPSFASATAAPAAPAAKTVKNEILGWTCPHCQFFNTSNKEKCTYCGKAK